MKVVVTIPAYNEEKSIGEVIKKIKEVMQSNKYNFKILVVDDGSRDRTKEVARENEAIVFSHPVNMGLAETFRTEIEKCLELKVDIIVHIDADNQYRAEEIPLLIKGIEDGYDLVLGSRFNGKIEYMPFLKRLGNKAFSRVISKIIRKRITDCQTGFRAFTSNVAKKVRISSTHTYTQEQIIRAIREKFKIKEVPVHFDTRNGKSRLLKHPFEYAIKAWINIFRIYRDYQPLKFFGAFGLSFLGSGLLLVLYALILTFLAGRLMNLGTLIIGVLFILTGVQISLFGFLADMRRE